MMFDLVFWILGNVVTFLLDILDWLFGLLPNDVQTAFSDALDSFDDLLSLVPSGVVNEIVPLGTFIAALQFYLVLRLGLEIIFFLWFTLAVIPFFGVPNFENPKRYLTL